MSHTELKRILYVEDELDIQVVARLALENVGGLELEICSSGHEALEKAANFNPDLLLLDVMMPGMTGPETLKALREIPELSQTPAMFMTAKVQPQEVTELINCGAIDVIPKPFEAMKLADQIKASWLKNINQA